MFELGQTVATTGVTEIMNEIDIAVLITRHVSGDWGDMCREDRESNETALSSGEGRLFSSYNTPAGKVWIITEADRSVTTVLLPSEY